MSTRISTAQLYSTGQANIANAKEKHTATAEKAATGKEIVRASQDPSGWSVASNLKDDLSVREQVSKNASLASHVMTATENVLSNLQEYVQRAHEIAVSASGYNPAAQSARETVLSEAQALYESAIQALNTKYGNRTLMSGLKTQSPAFDSLGNYLGDGQSFEIEVDRGQKMSLNISAPEAILGEGRGEKGVNILDAFQRLVTGLRSNDTVMIQSTLEDFLKGNDQISLSRADIGGRMNQLARTVDNHEINKTESKAAISKLEEADAVKVFSDLARDQAVLQAAMTTTHKLLTEDPTGTLFK